MKNAVISGEDHPISHLLLVNVSPAFILPGDHILNNETGYYLV